ncbi:cyclin-domain-containing protein [Irpex rosettiformis]|uniref:Cyclin-domain-containing protein n=1 Tax=Irpex rosettiformis TaxID=378272 RepID=A0ACB8UDR2_9APHY|nr:cyclin-domain-containing protein [Irpex rosettiformis]
MLALAPPPQQHTAVTYPTPSTSSTAIRPPRQTSRRPSSYSSSLPLPASNSSTVTTPTHPSSSVQEETSHSQRSGPHLSHSHQPQPSSSRQNGNDLPGTHTSHSHQTPSHDSIPPLRSEREGGEIDIYSYDSQDLLRLLASLLTQIATTNDNIIGRDLHAPPTFRPHSGMPGSPISEASRPPIWRTLTTASKHALSTNMWLTFHARNIPTISLEAYLLRILRYCPASNEVFLSLLVYFDRMSRLAKEACGRPFIIDSFNIHRLVIAGVTVASKFFSDVFYTNSRYAKVGGLPQDELNQLELQFLLLNNFSLMISPEEMQRYAEQLVHFSCTSLSSDSTPSPSPIIPTQLSPAGPSKLFGSVDPRPIAKHDGQYSVPPNQTPQAGPREMYRRSSSSFSSTYSTASASDAASETSTEFDGSTDDEPTIRPPHSSASSETMSLHSASDTDSIFTNDGDRDQDDSPEAGSHTPGETQIRDYRMMSP